MQHEYVTLYLAGPMTGIPQFNYPEFRRIAKELREAGYKVISPVEEDTEEYQEQAMLSKDGRHGEDGKFAGLTWADILAKDVKLVADKVDGVVVMNGWGKSRGARLEVFVANLTGRSINVYAGEGRIRPMSEAEYLHGILDSATVLGGSDYGRRKAV